AGANVLTGRGGRDVIIGGGGADHLSSDGGEDILIAGTTIYDSNASALDAIMAEWGRTDRAYQQRVDDLHFGAGTNGSVVLDTKPVAGVTPIATVTDDTAAAVLTGGAALDWFFVDLAHGKITDKAKAENVN